MKFELKQACYVFYTAFTAATIVSVGFAFALGYIDLTVVGYFVSIALMCLFPFLQLLWFTPAIIRRASYTARVAGFGLTYLPIRANLGELGDFYRYLPGHSPVHDPGLSSVLQADVRHLPSRPRALP